MALRMFRHSGPSLGCVRVIAVAAALTSATSLFAQSGAPARRDVALAGSELPAGRLVDLAAELSGLRIEYDPREVARVPARLVRHADSLSPDDVWRIMNRSLETAGLVTVALPDGSGVVVSTADRARATVAPTRDLPTAFPPSFVRWLYDVDASDPERLASRVTAAVGRGVQLSPVDTPRGAALVVEGPTELVRAAAELMPSLDDAAPAHVVLRYQPDNVDPDELRPALAELIESAFDRPGSDAVELLSSPDGAALLLVGPAELLAQIDRELLPIVDAAPLRQRRLYVVPDLDVETLAASVRHLIADEQTAGARAVTADPATGTLAFVGEPRQHQRVEELIRRSRDLASAATSLRRTYQVEHRDTDELAQLVLEAVADAPRGLSPEALAEAPATAVEDAPSASSPNRSPLRLLADPATQRIVFVGPPPLVRAAVALAEELDVRERQVTLDVLVVSLSEGDTFDLGVELARTTSVGDTLVTLASLFGLSDFDPADGIDQGDVGAGGNGFTGVVLNPGEFSVLVRALETVSQGRSLNRTRLIVTNGEEAVLSSARQEPFIQTNASDTVATTSFGGSSNAGLQIALTPEISSGGYVRLGYDVSLSAFVGESADPALPPPRQESSVASVTLLPDTFTVAVGGIEIADDGESASRVPLIGSIPIIGEAFKNRSRSDSSSRFYVFVRPVIVRSDNFDALRRSAEPLLQTLGLTPDLPDVRPVFLW